MKEKKVRNLLKLFVIFAGAASVALGTTVIIGWHTGAVTLIQVYPTFVPMQYNTALAFLLSGLGILAYMRFGHFPIPFLCASLVAVIGILTLIEYIFQINIGLDQLFMRHYVGVKTSHMGRMAPNTALSFLLTGVAIAMVSSCNRFRHCTFFTAILAALVLGLAIIAFSGYITGLESAYGWGRLTQMAVHTSLGFVILGFGLSLLAWLKEQEKNYQIPYWLPIPIAIAVVTFSVSLWQALHHPTEVIEERVAHHFILVFGLILAFALALAVNFMLKSFRQSASLKKAHDELEVRVRERTEELATANRELLAQMAERKRAEKELEQKRRLAAMGEMSAHVAHEIRDPLNKVSLSHDILNKSTTIGGNDREALQIMGVEIENLISLATDLLDYGRGSSLNKETFECCSFLDNIIAELEEKTDKSHIEIVKKLPQTCSTLSADKVKLHQLILNMFNNAIEAMPGGGTMTLEAKSEGGNLIINISDSGSGIAEEDLENIFMPFFTTKTSGTGLGMAIAKQYATLHGGDIFVKSKKGKGTTVSIILPLIKER